MAQVLQTGWEEVYDPTITDNDVPVIRQMALIQFVHPMTGSKVGVSWTPMCSVQQNELMTYFKLAHGIRDSEYGSRAILTAFGNGLGQNPEVVRAANKPEVVRAANQVC